jgi:hypothetical protein
MQCQTKTKGDIMRTSIAFMLIVVFLAGCASPPQQASTQGVNVLGMAKMDSTDRARLCQAYGQYLGC